MHYASKWWNCPWRYRWQAFIWGQDHWLRWYLLLPLVFAVSGCLCWLGSGVSNMYPLLFGNQRCLRGGKAVKLPVQNQAVTNTACNRQPANLVVSCYSVKAAGFCMAGLQSLPCVCTFLLMLLWMGTHLTLTTHECSCTVLHLFYRNYFFCSFPVNCKAFKLIFAHEKQACYESASFVCLALWTWKNVKVTMGLKVMKRKYQKSYTITYHKHSSVLAPLALLLVAIFPCLPQTAATAKRKNCDTVCSDTVVRSCPLCRVASQADKAVLVASPVPTDVSVFLTTYQQATS